MVLLFYNNSINTKLTMREANYTNDDNYKVFNSHSNSMGIGKLTTAITIITQMNNIV